MSIGLVDLSLMSSLLLQTLGLLPQPPPPCHPACHPHHQLPQLDHAQSQPQAQGTPHCGQERVQTEAFKVCLGDSNVFHKLDIDTGDFVVDGETPGHPGLGLGAGEGTG